MFKLDRIPNALRDERFDVPVAIDNASVRVTSGPGLGVDVGRSAMQSFLVKEGGEAVTILFAASCLVSFFFVRELSSKSSRANAFGVSADKRALVVNVPDEPSKCDQAVQHHRAIAMSGPHSCGANMKIVGCDHLSHQGSRPISIVWKLRHHVPARIFRTMARQNA